MKKILFSIGLVTASAFYVIFGSQNPMPAVSPTVVQVRSGTSEQAPIPVPVATPTATQNPLPTPTPAPTPKPTPAPAPAPKPVGLYTDGIYTGSVADAYYGNVQVKVVVSGGKITDVQFLQYPNTHSTSIYINNQAMPYLKQEAIKAQNSNVSIVSGATDTSMAFQQSLAAALTQAKA